MTFSIRPILLLMDLMKSCFRDVFIMFSLMCSLNSMTFLNELSASVFREFMFSKMRVDFSGYFPALMNNANSI